MRCIIVGTSIIQFTPNRSMASSDVSASNRDSTTMWFPVQSAWVENTNGPLWYSGPGTRCTPSRPMPNGPSRSGLAVAGAPDRMIFGRPVLPPEVGAFHDAAMGSSGSGSSLSSGVGLDRDDHHELRLGELDDRVALALREPVRDRVAAWHRTSTPRSSSRRTRSRSAARW